MLLPRPGIVEADGLEEDRYTHAHAYRERDAEIIRLYAELHSILWQRKQTAPRDIRGDHTHLVTITRIIGVLRVVVNEIMKGVYVLLGKNVRHPVEKGITFIDPLILQ